ncbi:MAG TPA: HAD family hydrolase [Polyangiaceae bacterium]|nr:HAD family hydrolase [Polyangiaceae bacterium]
MSAPVISVSPAELVRELEGRLRPDREDALSFDADGTLWSGDVGEDVFRFAITHGRLREAARAEVDRQARIRGFTCFTDVNATAQLLFEAYLEGRYREREICELMTWCYAGHSLSEMAELVREALVATKHDQRLNEELRPVLEFARERGLRTIVVSASPRVTVEIAAGAWGFAAHDVAAATPRVVSGVIAAEMAAPVPYGADKCVAGRALLGTSHWLGAFGDNVFDMDMLLEAELGVAVRPKPALRARLEEIPGVRLLDANFQSS